MLNINPESPNTDVAPRPFLSELLALSKPRVIELLITTALPAMFLASRGFPDAIKIFGVLIGGTLAAGSSNAINSIIEKDIDMTMNRTKHRPMAENRLAESTAWTFAILSQIMAFALVAITCNFVAAFFTLLASFIYVVIYTIWLKPRTDQNIVIGGAAGALPVIIGYSAVTGTLNWQAGLMFLIVFLWTPAHFWALSIYHEKDYRRGGFPMMPITQGKKKTSIAILLYTFATVATSLLLIFDRDLNIIYATSASILGIWFILEAARLAKNQSVIHRAKYMNFFHISNGYLAILFIAIAIDAVIK